MYPDCIRQGIKEGWTIWKNVGSKKGLVKQSCASGCNWQQQKWTLDRKDLTDTCLYINPYNLSTKPKYRATALLHSGHAATLVLLIIPNTPSATLGYFRLSICTAVGTLNYECVC